MKKNLRLTSISLILVLVFALAAFAPVAAEGTQLITVKGTGSVALQPDIAIVQIAVNTSMDNIQDALKDNTDKVTAVKKALLDLGIAEEDIKTTSFSLYGSPKSYDSSFKSNEYIFTIYYSFSITLRDVTKLNEALDACINNGANTINSVSYDSSKRAETVTEARNLAIEDANAKAQQIAEKLGVTIDKVDSFKMLDDSNYYMTGAGGMGGGGGTPAIDSGDLTVQVGVEMGYTYTFK